MNFIIIFLRIRFWVLTNGYSKIKATWVSQWNPRMKYFSTEAVNNFCTIWHSYKIRMSNTAKQIWFLLKVNSAIWRNITFFRSCENSLCKQQNYELWCTLLIAWMFIQQFRIFYGNLGLTLTWKSSITCIIIR